MQPVTRRRLLASGVAAGLVTFSGTAAGKPKSSDGTLRLKVRDAVADAGLCHLPRDTAAALGVTDGQQVRLHYDDAPVLFTVVVHDDKFGAVSPGGRDRLGATKNSLHVDADAQAVHPTMDAETAAETGEFVERYVDGDATVIAVAPHGGYIEYGTDDQAARVAATLDASAWYCSGWWPGGGAYRRWHVTSTRIEPDSFPALGAIRDIGYDTAVSFHGWREAHIGVGGTASDALRKELRDEISVAVDGAIEVRLATDSARNGTDPDNLVNWLTASGTDGVQIEQPLTARTEYGTAIADAVGDVLARQVA